jgi:hypothetical protein
MNFGGSIVTNPDSSLGINPDTLVTFATQWFVDSLIAQTHPGAQTLTYTQLAPNNTLAISGGNTVTFLTGTELLSGLLDTARAHTVDSVRNKLWATTWELTLDAPSGSALNSNHTITFPSRNLIWNAQGTGLFEIYGISRDTTNTFGPLVKVKDSSTRSITWANAALEMGVLTNPMNSVGDVIVGGTAGAPTRLGIGANTYVLTSNGTTVSWQPSASGGVTTVGTFDGGTANANALYISGANIFAQSASATNAGMVNTGAQSFAGVKTLNAKLIIGTTYTTNGASLSMIGNTSASALSGNYGTYFSAINGLANTDPGAAGTYSTFAGAYLGAPTFAATNAITYTNAATLWVNGAPSASTNVTIGTAYALYVASGTSFFNGSINSSTGSTFTATHFVGNSSTPGIAAGAGAGSSPTVTISGTDQSGLITVVTGTAPAGVNAVIATITYYITYPSTTYVSLTPANATAALVSGATMVYTNGSATTFTINAGTTGLPTGTYIWAYNVGGK